MLSPLEFKMFFPIHGPLGGSPRSADAEFATAVYVAAASLSGNIC
jgi:hypothetical protein